MLLNRIKIVSYIFCSFTLKSVSAQDFGCYNVPSDNQYNGVYTSNNSPSSLSDFDWTIFKIEKSKDGYYKDYYKESAYFPKKLKLEGNILNGVKGGKWTFHFENGIYFITGNYFNGKKEGIWKDYNVYKANDTIWLSKANFKKDTIEGLYTEYFKNGKISKTTNYLHGTKNGLEIEYNENPKADTYYIQSQSNYILGFLDGEHLEFDNLNDTMNCELFSHGKRNGRCKYFRHGSLERIIDFRDDMMDGKYVLYYGNTKFAYEIECKNNLPFTVISAYDINGKALDIGTLKNGTGVLNCYYDNAQLKSKMEYKDQLIFGEISHYYESGKIFEEGEIYCNRNKTYKKSKSNIYIDDFNMFSAWQQNFSKGTDYLVYSEGGKLLNKIKSMPYNSIETDTILFQDYAENGNLRNEVKEIQGLKIGVEKKYFDGGQIEQIGNYTIVSKDSIKQSLKTGEFKNYHQNGNLKSEINYRNNKQFGKSLFYDDSGVLKRMEEIKENGERINVFNGDTVNRTDSNGQKQGKWINFFSTFIRNNCHENPNGIQYFKDNKPIGTWEYYDFSGTKLFEKFIWKDSVLSQYFRFDNEGKLSEEGYMFNQHMRTGVWKMYDPKRNFLKFKGEYHYGKKDGIWLEFRRNGKEKNKIKYTEGNIETPVKAK